MQRVRGSTELMFDAVEQVTKLVERTHANTAAKVFRPLASVAPTAAVSAPVKAVHDTTARGVYQAIRSVNRGARKLAGLGFDISSAVQRSSRPSGTTTARALPPETREPVPVITTEPGPMDRSQN